MNLSHLSSEERDSALAFEAARSSANWPVATQPAAPEGERLVTQAEAAELEALVNS